MILIIAIFAFLTPEASAQYRWGEDRLIAHFDNGVAVTGPGYSSFHCFYGTDSDVFVGIVEDSTSNLGDRFIIRKSFNNGLSWTRQNTFSATTIQIFSPSFCIAPSTGNIFVVCSASHGNEPLSLSEENTAMMPFFWFKILILSLSTPEPVS